MTDQPFDFRRLNGTVSTPTEMHKAQMMDLTYMISAVLDKEPDNGADWAVAELRRRVEAHILKYLDAANDNLRAQGVDLGVFDAGLPGDFSDHG